MCRDLNIKLLYICTFLLEMKNPHQPRGVTALPLVLLDKVLNIIELQIPHKHVFLCISLSLSRQTDGQGIALGCLLIPTVLCSTLHCSLHTAPHHSGESATIVSAVLYRLSVDCWDSGSSRILIHTYIDNMYVWTNEIVQLGGF